MTTSSTPKPTPRLQVPTRRVIVAVLLLVATQGALLAAAVLLNPSSVRAPRQPIGELPTTINGWVGADSEVDPRVIGSLGASGVVGRQYVNESGKRASVHVAEWQDAGEWLPHPPELCYGNAGWVMQGRTVKKPFDDGQSVVEEQTHLRDGQRVRLTYWYQLGSKAYFNRDGARPARMQFMGQSTRPPLYKVMLQTSDADETAHAAAVEALASEIKNWVARQ